MKRQIRAGVFETNSSTCHTLTMMIKKDYEKWQIEHLYLKNGKLYTKEEVINALQERDAKWGYDPIDYSDDDEFYEARRENGYEYFDDEEEYLEEYYKEFTTPSGETVVAFGKYGYDS